MSAPVGQVIGMYELRRYTTTPILAREFQAAFARELLPVLVECGFDLVGAWTVEVGEGVGADLLWLLRWDSLADREAAFAAVRSDPRNQRFREKNLKALMSASSQLLRPTEFSPLS